MSKRKGISADEKRNRLLDLFYEKKDFYQLKELEKIAPREKGIVSQAVKEVLQGLVDDNLVNTDKIGTCVYFWAFPSKIKSDKRARLNSIETDLKNTKTKLTLLKERLEDEKITDNNQTEYDIALLQLSKLEGERNNAKEEHQRYSHNTVEYLNTLRENYANLGEAVNRWTENINLVKSWTKANTSMEENVLKEQFSIPDDLDYVVI